MPEFNIYSWRNFYSSHPILSARTVMSVDKKIMNRLLRNKQQ